MKQTLLTSLIILTAFLGCRKDPVLLNETPAAPTTYSASGKFQKGPYKNGTPVEIYELDSLLIQTGRSFSSSIVDDQGSFSINKLTLRSRYLLVSANGYYFNEHFNKSSEGPLFMEAIIDTGFGSIMNVNILTHIIKPRIEQLVGSGQSFNIAFSQAEEELLQVLNVNNHSGQFHSRDLTNDGLIFAVSLLFQRFSEPNQNSFYNYTAELSSLLSKFRNDFKNDGLINDQALLDTLLYNANHTNLITTKSNLVGYYNSLGYSISVPPFEQFIYNFQHRYGNAAELIEYPQQFIYTPSTAGPFEVHDNLLDLGNIQVTPGRVGLAAKIPSSEELKIRITNLTSSWKLTCSNSYPSYGWLLTNTFNNGVEFTAQRKNVEITCKCDINGQATGQDSARIEYFAGGSLTPQITKTIYW